MVVSGSELTAGIAWKAALAAGSFFAVLIPLWLSVAAYRTGKQDKRFESYHKLIDDLVGANGVPYIDRQVAIIFELKRFKEYWPVTLKILSGLKGKWNVTVLQDPNVQRLPDEIDLTENFIRQKSQ